MEEGRNRKDIICILGMHRSGTSVVARASNLLGMFLGKPEHLMKPGEDNPEGYWENQLITDLNEEILNRLGGSWHEPPHFLRGWANSDDFSDLRIRADRLIQEESSGSEIWGWKDPRNCLTIPFWQQIIPNMRYIICIRNPISVCKSLETRNYFSKEKASRLWKVYTLSGFLNVGTKPNVITFYEDYFDRWERELEKLSELIKGPNRKPDESTKEQFRMFLQEKLWHHRESILGTLEESQIDYGAKSFYVFLRSSIGKDHLLYQPISDTVHRFSLALYQHEVKQLDQLQTLAQKDHEIDQLQAAIQAQEKEVLERDRKLINLQMERERFAHEAAQLQDSVNRYQATLNGIYSGMGWKILSVYWRMRDRSLSQGTIRRKIYDYIVKTMKGYKPVGPIDSDRGDQTKKGGIDDTLTEKGESLPNSRKDKADIYPKISIVASVYNKRKEVVRFLDSFMTQDYEGPFEIILVDDVSSDGTPSVIREYIARERASKRDKTSCSGSDIFLLEMEENRGQCAARNVGIRHANGSIILVIDSDCIVNSAYLNAHARAHQDSHYDIVIGPFNLETLDRDPVEVLKKYESDRSSVLQDMELQDGTNWRSFVNCITRNFSIKRRSFEEPLFDEDFGYRIDRESGFGWEDVEMGYRLYKQGLRLTFTEDAISIHQSHPSSCIEREKPVRSIRNFKLLFEKHSDLMWAARAWAVNTYYRICEWLRSYDCYEDNEDRRRLDVILEEAIKETHFIVPKRRLKILSYRWHCGHQYELHKLPHDFTLIQGPTNFTTSWDYESRPLRPNAVLRPFNEIDLSQFDLAILHFDENVLNPTYSNGILPADWGDSFMYLRSHLRIPLIGICHGTPQFYGQYDINYKEDNLMHVIEKNRQLLVEFCDDMLIICNSHQAEKEWGFKHSKVIWHGFDPSDYPLAKYIRPVITVANSMRHRPHYRGYFIYSDVVKGLPCKELGGNESNSIFVPQPSGYIEGSNDYAYAKFRNYVDTIRDYSIFFNPTIRAPMPRSRAEAMLCGLAIVTTNNHDVDHFIKNSENGFWSNDRDELREYLFYLIKNPDKSRRIGIKGRLTAMRLFSIDRYLYEWQNTLEEVLTL